jgi:prepilin-type N-terminal cleavage/methylation domain-containing protein
MRTRTHPSGFTLIELLISMVIVSVIGVSFTKLLMNQSRFFDHETNIRQARSIARNASNVLLNDLRMVQDNGGVTAAAADGSSITVVVPYRFGLVCSAGLLKTTVSMLPTDSSTVAGAIYGGWGWRNSATGVYNVVTATNPLTSGKPVASTSSSDCTSGGGAQISTLSMNGRSGTILDIPTLVSSGAAVGAPMFLWQKITYKFAASSAYPGKIGLWRNITRAPSPDSLEEIMAPFDASAHFEFYASGSDAPTVAPPAVTQIRGFDLVLNANSPRTVAGGTMSTSKVVTSVFFKNVSSF